MHATCDTALRVSFGLLCSFKNRSGSRIRDTLSIRDGTTSLELCAPIVVLLESVVALASRDRIVWSFAGARALRRVRHCPSLRGWQVSSTEHKPDYGLVAVGPHYSVHPFNLSQTNQEDQVARLKANIPRMKLPSRQTRRGRAGRRDRRSPKSQSKKLDKKMKRRKKERQSFDAFADTSSKTLGTREL